jgi:hypothetical protein
MPAVTIALHLQVWIRLELWALSKTIARFDGVWKREALSVAKKSVSNQWE